MGSRIFFISILGIGLGSVSMATDALAGPRTEAVSDAVKALDLKADLVLRAALAPLAKQMAEEQVYLDKKRMEAGGLDAKLSPSNFERPLAREAAFKEFWQKQKAHLLETGSLLPFEITKIDPKDIAEGQHYWNIEAEAALPKIVPGKQIPIHSKEGMKTLGSLMKDFVFENHFRGIPLDVFNSHEYVDMPQKRLLLVKKDFDAKREAERSKFGTKTNPWPFASHAEWVAVDEKLKQLAAAVKRRGSKVVLAKWTPALTALGMAASVTSAGAAELGDESDFVDGKGEQEGDPYIKKAH